MKANTFIRVELSGWGQSKVWLSQVRCLLSPFSLQTPFPGVTALSEVHLTEHPAGTLGVPWVHQGRVWVWHPAHRACTITWMHSSAFTPASEKKKKAGLRALRYFPLAKQIVLHVKSEISEILIFLPLLREWEGSLVFIPPDKTGCLLGWQIARIAGFDPETGEIKEEKKKVIWFCGLLWMLILWNIGTCKALHLKICEKQEPQITCKGRQYF